jgi:ribosomal protein S5
MEAQERNVISVSGRQRTEEGGRKDVCIGFRCVVGDKKSKVSRGRPRRKEGLGEGFP